MTRINVLTINRNHRGGNYNYRPVISYVSLCGILY